MNDHDKTKNELIEEIALLKRRSEEQYKELINGMTDTVWVIDFDANIIDVNRAAVELLGYSKEELLAIGLPGIDSSLKQEDIRDLASAMPADGLQVFETSHTTKDGRTFPVEVSSSLVTYQGKKAILSVARDITERKRVEEALRESEERYGFLVKNTSDYVARYSMSGKLLFASDAMLIMLGYNPEEIINTTGFDRVYPDDRPTVQEALRKFSDNSLDEDAKVEYRAVCQNGSHKWVEMCGRKVWNDRTGQMEIIATVRDVSERKRVEEAICQSEEQFRTLFMSLSEGFYISEIIYDDHGNPCDYRFLEVNPKFEEILGLTRDQIIGKRYKEIVPVDTTQWLPNYCEVARTAVPRRHEFYSAQYEMYFETYAYQPVKGQVSVFVRDITERKQAEEALQKAKGYAENLIASANAMVVGLDANGNIQVFNEAAEKITGYSRAELEGKNWFEIIVPRERYPQVWEEFSRLMEGGLPEEFENTILSKSGMERIISWRSGDLHEDNRIVGIISFGIDITERKKAEERLEKTLASLREAVNTTVQAMVAAVEIRDPYTGGHQNRSSDLARAIAAEMGLPQEKIDGIRLACSIHDIGKLYIPAEILSKPSRLSEIEFSLVKEHSRKGCEILQKVQSSLPLAEIVYQHHERMDGSGYPRHLKRDEILMEARIIGVSDVVEAMASHRPYRATLGLDAALEEIEKNRGTLYDASVADACLRLFREKGYRLLA